MISLLPEDIQEMKQFISEGLKALDKMIHYGVDGVGPLISAEELATKATVNHPSAPLTELTQILIKGELKKNFASGFTTSLGGFISLPIAIPSSMAISWILQIRMVAAIAHLKGFDIHEGSVKTAILLCLLGKNGKELLESDFNQLQQKLTQGRFYGLPKKTLLMINQKIFTTLVKRAGQKGLSRVSKAIPFAGGFVGGTLDYLSAKDTADFALELFEINQPTPDAADEA